jgi:hypothetical protein
MGMHERDPRQIAYVALFIAIRWHRQLEPEQAWRIATGKSSAKVGVKVTPELKQRILKLTENPNFRTFNTIEKKFKINRYDIITSEEEIIVSKGNMLIKGMAEGFNELRKLSNNCIASDCEGCFLNNSMDGNKTLCEILMDIEIDEQGKPVYSTKRQLQQIVKSYNIDGKPRTRTFQFYSSALEKFEAYLKKHDDKKTRDIVSVALMEYMERHK